MKLCSALISLLFSTAFSVTALALPAQPQDASHPGSGVYQYSVEAKKLRIDGRDVHVFLPKELNEQKIKSPVVVFGHGQAIDVTGYEATFNHLARKGFVVIHPMYDTGFFDREWSRMATDFNNLTAKTLKQLGDVADSDKLVYAGHSKGGYIALLAAGSENLRSQFLGLQSVVLMAPAGYDPKLLAQIDERVAVTLVWSDGDNVIKKSLVDEIYAKLKVNRKQMITVNSYAEQKADHFFPLSKSFMFGGKNGVGPYHWHGSWKWLGGALHDLNSGGAVANEYIYGDKVLDSGDSSRPHSRVRSW